VNRSAGWEADLSDNDAIDADWNEEGHTPTAALVGVKGDSLEVLTLFLELSGWQCVVRPDVEGLSISAYQLVFIDEDVFHSGLQSRLAGYAEDLPIVLIAKSPARHPTRLLETGFPSLTVPLDLRAIEAIIENI
jgi:hypothetical protein